MRPSAAFAAIPISIALCACAQTGSGAARSDTTFVARGVDAATQAAARDASAALAEGHPFEATRRLAPLLAGTGAKPPALLLLAAAAAARWDGWSEVERLLAGQPWVDSAFDGRARELLARAALGRGDDTLALAQAERSLADVSTEPMRSVRLVLRARALDRLSRTDDAARDYTDAAAHLGDVADWLRLRAAGAVADPDRRRTIYGQLQTDVARSRIAITEAQALGRARDYAAAATAYDSLAMPARAIRMRLLALGAPRDSARSSALRRDALARLDRVRGDAARELLDVLDTELAPLDATEDVRAARAASALGLARRAATGFQRAVARGASLTASDRLAYGGALARVGQHRDAAAQLALVGVNAPEYDDAAYARARSLLRTGVRESALASLRALATRGGPRAAAARFLVADLASDDGREREARETYRALAATSPESPLAATARFRAAMIAFATGATKSAAMELDSLVASNRSGDETTAALYWSGRAYAATGDKPRSRERWREVVRRDDASYYAQLAARRLAQPAWNPASSRETSTVDPMLAAMLRRLDALATLGFGTERDLEIDFASDRATASRDAARELATADAMRRAGMPWRGIRLARAALAAGAPHDARLFRLLYPLPDPTLLRRFASEAHLEPALVAAIIHQESGFNPRATSVAGAVGLMQIMPDVGRAIARGRAFPVWDRALLFEPEVSVELGTAHLATMLASYPDLAYALAAYNAGQSPVTRWRTLAGSDDPELFVERIPYDETRDYVRIVTRNRAIYARLYGLESESR